MIERPDLAHRTGFDRAVERYDRARHGYPDALFDALFARLPAHPDIVEVGPGTGQATRSLLARGARVTAVEIGPAMAHRLAANLPGTGLEVVVSAFEDAELAAGQFDAVVAATSYHWVPVQAQLDEPARLLRPGGWLAVIDTIQVESRVDRGFWDRIQGVFQRRGAGPGPQDPQHPPTFEDADPGLLQPLSAADEFTDVEVLRWHWDQTYTAAQYGDLHRTYSGWLAMAPADGERLLTEVCAVIDAEYGGTVIRPLAITLLLGRHR